MTEKKRVPLLLDEQPILVYPTLAKLLKNVNKAIILQQLHFLLNVTKISNNQYNFIDGKWWVYNTYEQWRGYFPWISVSTIKGLFGMMEDDGLIQSMQSVKDKWDRRKWYTIDYEAFNGLVQSMGQNLSDEDETKSVPSSGQQVSDDNRNTDTTSEVTTEDTSNTPAPNGLGSASTPTPKSSDPTGIKTFYETFDSKQKLLPASIDGKLPIVTNDAIPLTPSAAEPPSPPETLNMKNIRDVVANKWFDFNSPKYAINAPAKTLKKIDDIVSIVITTFPNATDDRFAWAALEFCKHWATKKDRSGKQLAMPIYIDTFGNAWRKWLNEHPEIMTAICEPTVTVTTGVFQSFSSKKVA